MNFLILVAMDEELNAFLKNCKFTKVDDYYQLSTNKHTIYLMKGGIGKVSMAFKIGSFTSKNKVDFIINTGVAGSISSELKPLETLVANRCAYHDVDVTAFGYKLGQMCSCPLYFESDQKAINIVKTLNYPNVKVGLILSGDSFITKENLRNVLDKNFDNPLAVDMESTCVSQCAYILNIPFLIIRTISDSPDNEGNKETYEALLDEAASFASKLTLEIINKMD